MQILTPAALYLAALAIIPIALYFFRRKSKTVKVSTLVFFKSLAREHRESAWLRHLKKLLSLLLTLLIFFGAIFALTRFVFSPEAASLKGVVILLDRSASMAAKDASGVARFDAAKDELRARLAALPDGVPVALIAYDSRPEVVLPRTENRRALLRALDDLALRPLEDDATGALNTAAKIAALDTPSEIWRVSDSPLHDPRSAPAGQSAEPGGDATDADGGDAAAETGGPHGPALPEGVALAEIRVALPEPVNAGITAFQVRPVPLQHAKFEAYVQVSLSSSAPQGTEVKLEVQVGAGVPLPRYLDLAPGGSAGFSLPVEGAAGQDLKIAVRVEGDCFALDNEVIARLPAARPIIAHWITEDADPFTRLALQSIAEQGELEIWGGGPDAWPPQDAVDVVIFDGWLPDEWPKDIPAIAINPPKSVGPVSAVHLDRPVPHDNVRVANENHPVLFRVSSGRIAVTQTAVIEASGSLEPLWFSGSEPLLAAGEVAGQRLVLMAFSPQKSESLPLMASYPLLIGNALFWCAESQIAQERPQNLTAGAVIPTGGQAVAWEKLLPASPKKADAESAPGPMAELDQLGLWKTADGRHGSALLLSSRESLLLPGEAIDAEGGTEPAAASRLFRGEITWLFIWAILAALVIESWLFHRHAVY